MDSESRGLPLRVQSPIGEIESISKEEFRQRFAVEYTTSLSFANNTNIGALLKIASRWFNRKNTRRYSQQLRQGVSSKIYLARVSDLVGYGVFAEEDIVEGALICECTGVVRPVGDVNENWSHLFGYFPHIIDAESSGNYARFVNHSERPNVEHIAVWIDGVRRVIVVATAMIPKGQQLLLRYPFGLHKSKTFIELAA